MARREETVSEDKFEKLIELLTLQAQAAQPMTPETLKAIMAETGTAMHKALKPENDSHPGISAYSYPEGDRAKSREHILTKDFYYNGFPVRKFWETHHWRELELAEAVQPGTFTVLRTDGTPMIVDVKGERNANGDLTKVDVVFGISREERHYIPPMSVVLYQLVHTDNPKKRFMEAMTEHLQTVAA